VDRGYRRWSTGPPWTGGRGRRCARAARRASCGGGAMAGFGEFTAGALQGTMGAQRGHRRVARECANAMRASAGTGSGRGGGCAWRSGSTAAALLRRGRAPDWEREDEREGHRRIPYHAAKLGETSSSPETQHARRPTAAARAPVRGNGGGSARLGLAWRRGFARVMRACGAQG